MDKLGAIGKKDRVCLAVAFGVSFAFGFVVTVWTRLTPPVVLVAVAMAVLMAAWIEWMYEHRSNVK